MGIPTAGRSLSPALQALRLRHIFPQASCRISTTGLVWSGSVTPTPLARQYLVRITYTNGMHPKVIVVDPLLEPDARGHLPHVFRDGSLCLYEGHQWHTSLFIADSVLPWISESLAHYELWKRDGHWYGDGDPADR